MDGRAGTNLVGRKVAIQPLAGEFVEGVLLPDAIIERLVQTGGQASAIAKLDVPVIIPDPSTGNESEVSRILLRPYHSDLQWVFSRGGPPGMPVVAEVRGLTTDINGHEREVPLGKAALWRAPDSTDSRESQIPSEFDLELQAIEATAEEFRTLLLRKYGIAVSYDRDTLLRLDDTIDRVVGPRISRDDLGALVVPWADLLTKAIIVVFAGEPFQDPADGIKVRISTGSGFYEVSPVSQMWTRLASPGAPDASIRGFVEKLLTLAGR